MYALSNGKGFWLLVTCMGPKSRSNTENVKSLDLVKSRYIRPYLLWRNLKGSEVRACLNILGKYVWLRERIARCDMRMKNLLVQDFIKDVVIQSSSDVMFEIQRSELLHQLHEVSDLKTESSRLVLELPNSNYYSINKLLALLRVRDPMIYLDCLGCPDGI